MRRSPDVLPHVAGSRRVLVPIRHPVGGIRTYILYHYPYLSAAGYEFTFVFPAGSEFRRFADDVCQWPGAELVEAPTRKRKVALRSAIRAQLKTRRFALIHSHGMTAAVNSVLANIGLGIPHVATSHDVFLPRHFVGWIGEIKRRVLEQILMGIDVLITVSDGALENHRQYLPGLAKVPRKLVAIRNGIDVDRFCPNAFTPLVPPLRERVGVNSQTVLLGFLGRFMEQKGFLPLLQSLVELQRDPQTGGRFRLVAVGSGDYEREYRIQVERLGLCEVVTFLPAVANVAPVLAQVDALVMPSLWEACGLLAMEAMLLGIPIIVSDCIGLRDVVEGTPARVVPPGDIESWAIALRNCILNQDPREAREFVTAARARFSADQAAKLLIDVFQRCP